MSTPASKEEQWVGTAERKYCEYGQYFIKRSLRPSEYLTGYKGVHIPPLGTERLMNEAASMQFIRDNTDIPVPTLYSHFPEDGAYYLVTEFVGGISMAHVEEEKKNLVRKELELHGAKLRTLTSMHMGGPSGIVIPPYRVLRHAENESWNLQPSTTREYVFCDNDLSQENVIVDPETLKIKAILDWEYAGFYPPEFEYPFYHRRGPSAAIGDETDDSIQLLDKLRSKQIDVAKEE